jgi:hypothetical protein
MATASKDEGRDNLLTNSVRTMGDAAATVTRDTGRLIRAWTEANAGLANGMARVTTDLIRDLTEAVTPSRREEGDKSSDANDLARQLGDLVGDVARTLNSATAESAKLLEEASGRFSEVYEEERPAARKTSSASKSN